MQAPIGRHRADGPAPSVSQAQYAQRAPQYDLELAPFEPYRVQAIAALQLLPGETVLDVGCGTGLSFAALQDAVQARGHIVGIEPCAEMLALARERVARHHWSNVQLLADTAAAAPLRGKADAALFHFTHDVLRDAVAIDHVLRHLKPGARIVATGLQWAPPWMLATNAFVLAAALYSTSSIEGLACPWEHLQQRLRDVHVQAAGLGGVFIISGRLAG